uniref:Uncharacterized protein n=1 Tax=Glossina palpalis gambiensis TaxID=67801 RepID=A0A1B0BT05_9MUSC
MIELMSWKWVFGKGKSSGPSFEKMGNAFEKSDSIENETISRKREMLLEKGIKRLYTENVLTITTVTLLWNSGGLFTTFVEFKRFIYRICGTRAVYLPYLWNSGGLFTAFVGLERFIYRICGTRAIYLPYLWNSGGLFTVCA